MNALRSMYRYSACFCLLIATLCTSCTFSTEYKNPDYTDPNDLLRVAFLPASAILQADKGYPTGDQEYRKRFGSPIDENADVNNLETFKKIDKDYYKRYTSNTLILKKNLFCATINPKAHDLSGLAEIIQHWRNHLSSGDNLPFQAHYIGTVGLQEGEHYCWAAALQFILFYQFKVYIPQEKIISSVKANSEDSSINSGSFLDIMSCAGYKKVPWWVAVNSDRIMINAPQDDFLTLLALRNDGASEGHIVILMGSSYSFVVSKNIWFMNALAEVPLADTVLHPCHFVFHKLLIFDPLDASIGEYDPDYIFKRTDFIAVLNAATVSHSFETVDATK